MDNLRRSYSVVKDLGLTLLAEGKTIRIKAHGYSMYPAIKPGSLILIEPLSVKGLPRVGEIVAIRRDQGLIVHRVTEIINKNGTRWYITRGDSNGSSDKPIKMEMIAGRITGSEGTGENPVPADVKIKTKPAYILNRFNVIRLILTMKLRKFLK